MNEFSTEGITTYHYVSCPLCGSQKSRVCYPATNSLTGKRSSKHFCCTNSFLAQHGDIVKCDECGMVYNNPQPDPDELLRMYVHIEDVRYSQEEKGREHTFKRSLQQLQDFSTPPGKLLDIGCYTGKFLEVAANEGWDVAGVELSSWAAKIARDRGIGEIYEGQLAQISHLSHAFDVITLWDVIEHLQNPAELLRQTAALLKSGGLLALSTYLIDRYPVRILGTHYPFFMDMHLVHFSQTTLQRMLFEQGFELLSIVPHQRIVTVSYFLEKIANMLPNVFFFLSRLKKISWLEHRFITVKWSGLVNVFAKCMKL